MPKLEDMIRPGSVTNNVLSRVRSRIKISDAAGDHWFWLKTHNGDGEFFIRKNELMPNYRANGCDGKRVSARRLVYLLYNGEIPEGKRVKSICDTRPLCVNPEHLRLVD